LNAERETDRRPKPYTHPISDEVSVLFICTGNICRSVMAEALLRAAIPTGAPILVHSAGLAAEGVAPPRRVLTEMRKRGLDVSGHRSRRLDPALVDESTLVIGVARTHAWEAVAMVPDAITRTFTFKELIRLSERIGWRDEGESLDDRLSRVHEARRSSLPVHVGDDIVDPMGASRRTFARVADEIDGLTKRLVPLLFPPNPGQDLSSLSWRAPTKPD
jgi:protein-tyrosine-phosphatase